MLVVLFESLVAQGEAKADAVCNTGARCARAARVERREEAADGVRC